MLGGELDQLRGPRTTVAAPLCHTHKYDRTGLSMSIPLLSHTQGHLTCV
jgi:hypothetical protein